LLASLKAWRSRVGSALWEWRLGVNTRTDVVFAAKLDYNWYSTISYREIFAVLDNLSLGSADIFVDLGCGPGRVVCCAAQLEVREAVGVEVDERLAAAAERNAAALRQKKSPVRLVHGPAEAFGYAEGDAFYLFNPFGAETLGTVLDRLGACLASRPRQVRIAYVNPEHEFLLDRAGWLTCYDRWVPGAKTSFGVSFWRAKGGAV
jgi:SAM-dependent methyltransferase